MHNSSNISFPITHAMRAVPKLLFYRPGIISTSKNPHIQIHTPSRDHTPDRLLASRIILTLPTHPRVSIRDDTRPLDNTRRPSDTAYEMAVGIIERFNAFTFLSQIPAPDGFVVADGKEVFTTGMEEQATDPVVVSDQGFDQGAS